VAISLVRGQIEKSRPPRALHVEFPLGRPLGKPNDPEYQTQVLTAAFALLDEPSGPVLVDYPDVIEDESADALACTVPPRFDPDLHPAIDEATGLLHAYHRTVEPRGTTSVGRAVQPEDIAQVIEAMIRIADGTPMRDAEIPGGDVLAAAMDIRMYYEEAAQSLVDHIPGARQVDTWLYQETEVGKVMHAAQRALHDAEVPKPLWFFLMPLNQSRIED
jgi:hypothetical protein